jgi:pimeloyl-ACP methyl ester carboxylesterase
LNYEIWGDDAGGAGDARWVTLVNGHTRPLNDFRLLARRLVERGLRVLAFDNRGAGATQVRGPFRLSDMADDVVALWDALGIRGSGLLGISMGGFISLTVTLGHPGRVSRLCLVSTAMGPEHIRSDETPWEADEAKALAKFQVYVTEGFARRNAALLKSMAAQTARAVASGRFQEASEAQRQAIKGFDASARVGEVRVPTLVIHGEDDRIIQLAAGKSLAARIPGARLLALPETGHLLLAERPKELAAAVGDFFS